MKLSRGRWTALGLGVGVLAAGTLLFWPSEERRIEGVLREISHAIGTLPGDDQHLRRARLDAVFAARVLPEATLTAPDLGRLGGREVRARFDALGSSRLETQLEQVDVTLTGPRSASVSALGTLELTVLDGRYRDRRPISVALLKRGGQWKVLSVTMEARSRAQPEARP